MVGLLDGEPDEVVGIDEGVGIDVADPGVVVAAVELDMTVPSGVVVIVAVSSAPLPIVVYVVHAEVAGAGCADGVLGWPW